jgi:general secretion pathway protein B
MSYILEALRRAEAERQRGAVPGLHAQPASAALADAGLAPAAGTSVRWSRWLLAAAALLVVAAGAVWLRMPAAPDRPAVLAAAPPVVAPVVSPAVAPATVPPPATVARATSPALTAPAPAMQPSPSSTGLASRPAPPVVAAVQAVAPSSTGPGAAGAVPAVAPAAPTAAVAASLAAKPAIAATAPPARLPTLAELPDTLRRELPALSLGGAVYADQPAQRMVIVNGQVFHEGDRLGADLQVQEIRLKSVVFNLRGQRFEMAL